MLGPRSRIAAQDPESGETVAGLEMGSRWALRTKRGIRGTGALDVRRTGDLAQMSLNWPHDGDQAVPGLVIRREQRSFDPL